MELCAATPKHFAAIVDLNSAEEEQTSAMNRQRLEELHKLSSYHRVALVNNKPVGFLLAMRETAPYINDNFLWFASHYEKYFYVDRIVVAKGFAGRGIGTTLYEDLMDVARADAITAITCEYNISPPNAASAAFHDSFGFKEVGRQRVAGGKKLVSLQAL